MQWTFGTFLWSMVVFFFWFTVIWMFIALFADIFRRNMSGWAKARWIILMVILPFIGILAYLIARPKTEDQDVLLYSTRRQAYQPTEHGAADEIAKTAELRDQGRIRATEYETIKQHALSYYMHPRRLAGRCARRVGRLQRRGKPGDAAVRRGLGVPPRREPGEVTGAFAAGAQRDRRADKGTGADRY